MAHDENQPSALPDMARTPQGSSKDASTPRSRGRVAVDTATTILNAVVGDYLKNTANDLATQMAFYDSHQPITLTPSSLRATHPHLTTKIVVLVHGMSCTEDCWTFPQDQKQPARAQSYGTRLASELGFTPFYLRYNTGLRISENGRAFAELLEQLYSAYRSNEAEESDSSLPIRDLTLIGHSMGGLLIRSACYYGEKLNHRWLSVLRRAIYIGSPHLGAPLEKIGNVITSALSLVQDPVVRLTRKILNLRSAGIKDLRFANLVDEDWQGRDPDAFLENGRTAIPLCKGAEHYVIAGMLGQKQDDVLSQLMGDLMVRVDSACGRTPSEARDTAFLPENIRLFPGVAHPNLAHEEAVYHQIRAWCEDTSSRTAKNSADERSS